MRSDLLPASTDSAALEYEMQARWSCNKRQPDPTMNKIAGQTLVFLDVETTGLSAWFGDRVCEIAALRTQGGQIIETFHSLVNPERAISPGAARVNGLSDEELRQAPRFAEIAGQVAAILENAILVCHNAPFDLAFIDCEFNRLGLPFSAERVIDTLTVARAAFDFPSNSLQVIADFLDIEVEQAHRALADVMTTRTVFRHMLSEFEDAGLDLLESFQESYSSPRPHLDWLNLPEALQNAIRAKKPVAICYRDARGSESQRTITPLEAFDIQGAVYITAYCHLRQEERNFRLDRIIEVLENSSDP